MIVSKAARDAVARRVVERRDDPAFRRRLRAIIARERAVLEVLRDSSAVASGRWHTR